jgi:hypothetical protein
MRPRGMRSKWVKLLPWYYTQRRQPTRAVEQEAAIADDLIGSGLDYDRLVDLVHSLPVLKPVEPIKLTLDQLASVKDQIPPETTPVFHVGQVGALSATPIHIVATVEESTPYLKGWTGWYVTGHRPEGQR